MIYLVHTSNVFHNNQFMQNSIKFNSVTSIYTIVENSLYNLRKKTLNSWAQLRGIKGALQTSK